MMILKEKRMSIQWKIYTKWENTERWFDGSHQQFDLQTRKTKEISTLSEIQILVCRYKTLKGTQISNEKVFMLLQKFQCLSWEEIKDIPNIHNITLILAVRIRILEFFNIKF